MIAVMIKPQCLEKWTPFHLTLQGVTFQKTAVFTFTSNLRRHCQSLLSFLSNTGREIIHTSYCQWGLSAVETVYNWRIPATNWWELCELKCFVRSVLRVREVAFPTNVSSTNVIEQATNSVLSPLVDQFVENTA